MSQRNDLIEHLYRQGVINHQMRESIYAYYAYLDATESFHSKTPDVIYI